VRYLLVLGLLVGVARYRGWGPFHQDRAGATSVKLAALTPAAEAGDPCAKARRCVVVYLAPWCPACRQAKPHVKALRARLPAGAAMKVVIGQAERSRSQEMAGEVGGAVFFDPDGDYYKAIKGTGIPYWMVLDADQHVTARMAGFVLPLEAQLAQLGL
jgi:thiol-disulfide isomerase/thioredoxin